MELDTRICGIPCIVRVTHFSPGTPHGRELGDDPCWEYEVLDRRGRPAPWLARKIAARDEDVIYADYMSADPREF